MSLNVKLHVATLARQSKNGKKKNNRKRTKRANTAVTSDTQSEKGMKMVINRLKAQLKEKEELYQSALATSTKWKNKYKKKLRKSNDFNNAVRVIQHDINRLSCLIA